MSVDGPEVRAARRLWVAYLMALLGLVVCAVPARASAAVRVGSPAAPALPGSFAGLSIETDLLARWFNRGDCNAPVVRVLAFLGRPEVRIGGNSQDRLWPSRPLPPTARRVAGAAFLRGVRCLARTGAPLVVGLNLLGRDAIAAGDVLARVQTVVPPSQLTVALGNEPNMYGRVFPTWGDYVEYVALYRSTLEVLQARFGATLPPVAGPDAATWRWGPETVRFVIDGHPEQVDAHLYGLNGCLARRSALRFPTITRLLRPFASTDLVRRLAPITAAARETGIPAQISEANSVACGGKAGVSDTPASALWALSVMGSAATTGFGRIQFHSAERTYDAFLVHPDGRVTFRPLFSALVLADRLWPGGTEPLQLSGRRPAGVNAWAARRPDGRVALIAVNGDQEHAHHLELISPGSNARYGRLQAAGAHAVTLDARRLAWATDRPVWQGPRKTGVLAFRAGRATLLLPAASAAWVLLNPGPLPSAAERAANDQ